MDWQNLENFNKICRICLQLSSYLTSISLNNIITMIKACASVNIWLNDELPNQICKICLTRLQDSFDFKQLCEKSDNNLRQVLNNCKNVKCEISINDWDEEIVSKCVVIQNSRKDSDEQTQDSFVEDRDDQTLYDHENSTEICDEKTFSNNNENSEICDVQMFPKRDISDEYDGEAIFLVKNEVLDSDEEIQEDNTVESKEAEKRCVDPDKSKKLYTCEQCGRNCKNIRSFRDHMRRTHKKKSTKEPEKPFACEQCDGKFQSAPGLGHHARRVHKAEGTKCRYCSLICYHREHLKFHEDSHTRSIFKCDVCNRTFSHRFKVIKHMDSHKTERPFYCVQCDVSFKNKWILKKHNQTIHENMRKETECHICGKSVCTYVFQKHLWTHGEREPKFSCNTCGKKFLAEYTMKVHIDRIHENPANKNRYLCNICGLGVLSLAELKAHMRSHDGEKPFKCDKCDKKFRVKHQLKTHILSVHLKERNHVCSVCSRAFYNNQVLKSHMRIHTGERPYKCRICDKTFTFGSALYTHMKSH